MTPLFVSKHSRSLRRRRRAQSGFGLIEIMISLSVITVALLAFGQAILMSLRTNQVHRENTIAQHAARQILERMQAETFDEVFARYNATAVDDPAGGNLFAAAFDVPALNIQAGDADALVGQILFPTSPDLGGGLALREDLDDTRFGTPRDLNADGVVDALNHSGDYRLLPVAVRLEWRGSAGNASIEFRTFLADV